MKPLLIIISTLLTHLTLAQPLAIKGERIDTIVIESTTSSYQFDELGTTKGISEQLFIALNTETNSYVVEAHHHIQFSRTYDEPTNNEKLKCLNQHIGTAINNDLLEQLISSLQISLQPNSMNLSITPKDMRVNASKKEIMKVARNNDWAWQFKSKYSMKEDNELFFEACQSIDTFNLFLNSKFDSILPLMVTDYSNFITVKISTSNNCYSFTGSYPDPLRQPWSNNLTPDKEVINLNINRALEQILPDGFQNKGSISTQALFELYIVWYFKRNNMAG